MLFAFLLALILFSPEEGLVIMSAEKFKPQPIYTDEKVQRLIRVYGSIVVNGLLIVWQESIILKPLAQEGLEMVRNNDDVTTKKRFVAN